MRIFVLGIALGIGGATLGCATTVQPFVPSTAQQAQFQQVVRAAEAAGIDGPGQAASMLAEAKSDWVYAQHLPKYPERARQIAAKAMQDAEAALALARRTQLAVRPPAVRALAIQTPPVASVGITKVAAVEQPAGPPPTTPASSPADSPADSPER